MAKPKKDNSQNAGNHFQFNLIGLIIFSLCLVIGTALAVGKFSASHQGRFSFAVPDPDKLDKSTTSRTGPWGELLVQSIKLERPAELIPVEDINPEAVTWSFQGMNVAQIKSLFIANGLDAQQVEKTLSPDRISSNGNDTEFKPDDDFVLSLTTEQRQKLYGAFLGRNVNLYFDYPYIFNKESLGSIYSDASLNSDDVAVLKKLVYPAEGAIHLSDPTILMDKIPTNQRRVTMSQALSRQTAALARLCIRPDTDIDKIVSYWGHIKNVRFQDIRPLLESLKGLPNGGTVSLVYFLPPFARQRLYTFPAPGPDDKSVKDCHWSTFNFTSLQPDDNFTNPEYTVQYIKHNYYGIATPAVYGDIVLFMNDKEQIKHSAVYLADDLYFTKYGFNNSQPWMIVRMSDMQAEYSTLKPYFMRRNTD